MKQLSRFLRWFFPTKCAHHWRPCCTSKGFGRHCTFCQRTELLSDAEFYARFGRAPYL
jgi:hypothetical protein